MTDDLDLLRRHRGEPDPPSEEIRAAARHSLERAIQHHAHASGDTSPRGGTWFRRRSVALAAFVLVAAAAAIAAAAFVHSSSTPEPALAAGPVLQRLARVAAVQPRAVPGPGQYLYTTSHSLTESDIALPGGVYCRLLARQYRQNWIAANGEGLFRETNGPARYRTARESAACAAAPPQTTGRSDTWAAPGCLSINPIPLARLPRNPARLRARLLTGKVEGGPPGPAEAFVQVGDLLRETDAPPVLRAALYRAAAGLPGVRSLGTATDKLGRRGVGLAINAGGIRHELIFSATTSALLAEQDVLVGRARGVHAARGTVLDWSAYSVGRVVDSLPARPPQPLTPPCVKGAGTGRSVPGHPQDSVIVGSSARLHAPTPTPAPSR